MKPSETTSEIVKKPTSDDAKVAEKKQEKKENEKDESAEPKSKSKPKQ